MKKLFARFMKDTRGVVMLEYIILGLFAVAITLVGIGTLGKAYNNGLLAMAYATTGSATVTANTVATSYEKITADAAEIVAYAQTLADDGANDLGASAIVEYDVYAGN